MQIAHAQEREIAAYSSGRARMRLTDEILSRRQGRYERNAEHLHPGKEICPEIRAARRTERGRSASAIRYPAQRAELED